MNIPKANEILTDLSHPTEFTVSPDIRDALKLGIEALKQLQSCRLCCKFALEGLLPGETEN